MTTKPKQLTQMNIWQNTTAQKRNLLRNDTQWIHARTSKINWQNRQKITVH